MQRVNNARGGDDGGAVLIIMENWNIHAFAQLLLDDKTFRCFDVFKIDAAKCGRQHRNRLDKFFRIRGVKFEINTIDIGKFFEQHGLTFHHWFGRRGANITKTQHRGAIGNDRNNIAF